MHVCHKQEIVCQWTIDLSMAATLPYNAEVQRGKFCCCDSPHCSEDLASLPTCYAEIYNCEVEVTIMLSDCKKCPSVCCDVYVIGDRSKFSINYVSIQIDGKAANMVSNPSPMKVSIKYHVRAHPCLVFMFMSVDTRLQ